MLRKLQSSGAKLVLLLMLVFAAATSLAAPRAKAAGTTHFLLPDHHAEASYLAKFSPQVAPVHVLSALAHQQSMSVTSTLPPVKTWHPAAGAPTVNTKLSSANFLPPPSTSYWTAVGPAPLGGSAGTNNNTGPYGPNGGRTTAIAVDPTTAGATTVIYIGTVGGGVWKTVNNGTSWTPLTDTQLPTLVIGALAIDPTNHNVLYAGTGEGNSCGDCSYGLGLFKSINAGATWTQIGGSAFVSTTNPNSAKFIKIVANGAQVWAATRRGGLYKSVNGGSSFSLVTLPNGLNGTGFNMDDLAVYGSTVYLSASKRFSGNAGNGLYKSTNGGITWTDLTPLIQSADSTLDPLTNYGRAAIALAASNPNLLYLMVDDFNGDLTGAYKTINGGSTWTKIYQAGPYTFTATGNVVNKYLGSTPASASYIPTNPCDADGTYGSDSGQCWYDIYVGIDPGNANVAYFGGVDIALTTDGGTHFQNITRVYDPANAGPVHPDQHGVSFSPTVVNGKHVVYFANDGGVYSTSNAGVTFNNLNTNLNTLEVYYTSGGTNYANQHLLWNGMQDNGTAKFIGNPQWEEMFGGDGGDTAIDPTDQRIVYEEYIFAAINKSTDGGVTWNSATNGLPPQANGGDSKPKDNIAEFIAPFAIDPTPINHQHLVVGEDAVYETIDSGADWCPISQSLTGKPISIVAIAPSTSATNNEIMFAGMSDGTVWTTPATAGAQGFVSPNGPAPASCATALTWTEVDTGMPGNYVTDLAIDSGNPLIVYATTAVNDSSVAIAPGPHVYKTINGGTTWTALPEGSAAGNLPAQNYNSVVTYGTPTGSVVIVAGDHQVYLSTDGGANWGVLGNLPNAPIYRIRTDFANSTLVASLHGRGVWTMSIPQAPASGGGNGDTVGIYHTGFNSFSPATFDPTTFNLLYELTTNAAASPTGTTLLYGLPNDIPLVGDWNGDGISTIGLYRTGSNTFILKNSNDGISPAVYQFQFGQTGDLPIVGDWTHSGYDSIGVYRPSTGQFLLRKTLSAGMPDITITYGGINVANNKPVIGDWNGDGYDTVGIYNQATGVFSLSNSVCATGACTATTAQTFTVFPVTPGDMPVAGDWTHSGTDGIGIFRPSTGHFYLRNSFGDPVASPDYSLTISSLTPSGHIPDWPLVGHFNNNNNAPYIAPKGTDTTQPSAPTYIPPSN